MKTNQGRNGTNAEWCKSELGNDGKGWGFVKEERREPSLTTATQSTQQ